MSNIIIPKNHVAFTSCEDISTLCQPIFASFGITYFAHTIYYFKSNKVTTLITHGEIAKHWITNQYSMPGSHKSIPLLKSGYYLTAYMGAFYPEVYRISMREQFNIDHMIMYIDVFTDRYEFFSFATKPENDKVINVYLNNLHLLDNFIAYYRDRAKKLIKKANSNLVDLIPRAKESNQGEGNPFTVKTSKDLTRLTRVTQLKVGFNEITLSKRESDCLVYLSTGRTIKECAELMNISYRTTESYINSLKEKLRVEQRSELIDIFWDHYKLIKR